MKISGDIRADLDYIRTSLSNDPTLLIRELGTKGKTVCAVVSFDGMTDGLIIANSVILPAENAIREGKISPEYFESAVIGNSEMNRAEDFGEVLQNLMFGDTVMLFAGVRYCLVMGTKGWQKRSTAEPEGERVTQGPREGFVESMLVNLSMLRRRLKTTEFVVEKAVFGEYTNTGTYICYLRDRVNKRVLDELCRRLKKIKMEGVLDSNYIAEQIRDNPRSPFRTIGITERPDVTAAKLLEGRIALIVDGTPCVITLPHLLVEMFQSNEDYYSNYIYAGINRLLRIIGFIVTVALPGTYLALITHHQEALPQSLLLSITASRHSVPFPTIVEMLIMVLIFEILREASLRMPANIGQALSIVGALVLGQAAVEAQLVSAPLIIIIALADTTTLMIPKGVGATIVCKVWLIMCGALIGLLGVILGIMVIIIHIASLQSFGVSYYSTEKYGHQDILARERWGKLKYKKLFGGGK